MGTISVRNQNSSAKCLGWERHFAFRKNKFELALQFYLKFRTILRWKLNWNIKWTSDSIFVTFTNKKQININCQPCLWVQRNLAFSWLFSLIAQSLWRKVLHTSRFVKSSNHRNKPALLQKKYSMNCFFQCFRLH